MSAIDLADNAAIIERIARIAVGGDVIFRGGGKGQIAAIWHRGEYLSAKSTSRGAALRLLLNAVVDATPVFDAKPMRPTVDDAIAQLRSIFGDEFVVVDQDPDDGDQIVAPDWGTLSNPALKQIVPCVGECMAAHPNAPCECRCNGENHGLGSAQFLRLIERTGLAGAIKEVRPVRLEPKACLCGCGGITMRRFVPGHDARFHAAAKRAAKEAAAAE